jgi:Mlc titration factor MtfA (ptsG expression regulator)
LRTEGLHDRPYAIALSAVGVAGAVVLGGAVAGLLGAATAGLAGGAVAALLALRARHRSERRREVLARDFPPSWRKLLLDRYDHFERLPDEVRRRFEDDVKLFLDLKRITGIGVDVTEELRLLVAASAITLSAAWPGYEWDQLTEVLLYPDDFDRDYTPGGSDRSGEAHPWGTVILSVPALVESFDDPDDAFHVGVHEFAHLLDVDQTRFDGIPVGLDDARAAEWVETMEREMERMRKGRSILDDYGANDPVEFFAVAVEAFFEAPLALREGCPRIYTILGEYFRQDPAAWDDARGLSLEE